MTELQVLTVHLTDEHMALARAHAEAATIGGASRIRTDDRTATLSLDQVVGQMCELAVCLWLTKDTALYARTRELRNLTPTKGDGGADLLQTGIDVKGSRKSPRLQCIEHRLAVRPRERHKNTVYVLALADVDAAQVHVCGWLRERELPVMPNGTGPFEGAFVVKGAELHPPMPVWVGIAVPAFAANLLTKQPTP
jgi:hypothetical protein